MAAEHLNLEPSFLSRKISALEERLKVKLLYRSASRTGSEIARFHNKIYSKSPKAVNKIQNICNDERY